MAKLAGEHATLRRRQFQRLRERLYQGNRKNKALCFNKPGVTRFVRLSGWPGAQEPSAVAWLTRFLTTNDTAEPLSPLLPADEESRASILGHLEGLRREALRLRRELGLPALFLAAPILEWVDSKGDLGAEPLRSPLLLIPVELAIPRRRDTTFTLRFDESDIAVNPSLRNYLRKTLGDVVSIPDSVRTGMPWAEIVESLRKGLSSNECRVELAPESTSAEADEEHPPPAQQPTGAQVRLRLVVPATTPQPAAPCPMATNRSWLIRPEVWLGIFRYPNAKLVADYESLERNDESHDVADRLVGVPIPPRPLPEIEPDRLSERENFYVMSVDGSQQRAIAAVSSGHDVVIHGPPGTGKSQTIVNIVADCVAKGRTVLFVSEKAAALDVVYARLSSVGLGPFAMHLHRSEERRRMVAKQIGDALEAADGHADKRDNWDVTTDALEATRGELAQFHALLTAEHPSGACRRDIDWRLHKLRRDGVKDLPAFDPSIANRNEAELDRLLGRVRGFAERRRAMSDNQRFLESVLGRKALSDPEETMATLRTVLDAVEEERRTMARLVDELRERSGPRLATTDGSDLAVLAGCTLSKAPADYSTLSLSLRAEIDRLPNNVKTLEALQTRLKSLLEYQADLAGRFSPNIAPEDARRLAAALKVYLGRWTRLFRRPYRQLRRQTKALFPPDESFNLARAIEFLEWFADAQAYLAAESRAVLDECARIGMPATADGPFEPVAERTEIALGLARRLAAVWATAERFFRQEDLASFRQPYRHEQLEQELLWCHERATAFVDARERVRAQGNTAARLGRGTGDTSWLRRTVGAAAESIEAAHELARLEQALPEIPRFQAMEDARRELEAEGLADVVERIAAEVQPNAEVWARSVEASVLQIWSRQLRKNHPQRGPVDHQAIATARKELDLHTRRQVEEARRAVVRRLLERIQEAGAPSKPTARATAFEQGCAYLKRESYPGKGSKWPTAAEFVRTAREALLAHKPIWLMSPQSVADIMPLERGIFDVVVFDEASQVRPEDAIPTIWRGKQLVVCGDHKQLPPTDFFRAIGEDEEQAADPVVDDSVVGLPDLAGSLLDSARGALPEVRLDWHYRSRSEELIQFSNYSFYDGRLVTVPAAESAAEPAIEFHRLDDAVYGRGTDQTNPREAEHVADLVLRHLGNQAAGTPAPTIGVIALSMKQQAAIEKELANRADARGFREALDDEREREIEGQSVGLFVKNLETVQGDERDVVILSVGYGPGPDGRFHRNLGPINKAGGENRLNVAVSRARLKMIVVCSFDPDVLSMGPGDGGGVAQLARYLSYAKAVGAREDHTAALRPGGQRDGSRATRTRPVDTSWEEEVAAAIAGRGFAVKRQVGSGPFRLDFAVARPDVPTRWLCGIECDGPGYHASANVRDRELVRFQQFASRGWLLHSIWSPDWIANPDGELDRLISRLEDGGRR